jgi:hypothetical protein
MDSCETCKKKEICAEGHCMTVDKFIKSSRWIDWTEISCDEYEPDEIQEKLLDLAKQVLIMNKEIEEAMRVDQKTLDSTITI